MEAIEFWENSRSNVTLIFPHFSPETDNKTLICALSIPGKKEHPNLWWPKDAKRSTDDKVWLSLLQRTTTTSYYVSYRFPPWLPTSLNLVPVSQFSRSVMSHSLWPHGLQHARPPCPSPTPGVYSNSCPSRRWCHPAISSSVVSLSSCLQSFPPSVSFSMRRFFTSGGQSIGVSASASVLPMNIEDWFPLGWTGWISL